MCVPVTTTSSRAEFLFPLLSLTPGVTPLTPLAVGCVFAVLAAVALWMRSRPAWFGLLFFVIALPLKQRIAKLKGASFGTHAAGGLQDHYTEILATYGGLDPKSGLNKVNLGNNTGGIASLADLGITADANTGQLDTDSTTLTNSLTANLAAVGNLLGGTNGIATQLNTLINQYTGPAGLLSSINQGLQTSLSNVSQQQTALQAELATYSATLTSEYNAMDTAVASLKETQTYLTAEFNPSQSTSSSSSSTSSLGSGTLGT